MNSSAPSAVLVRCNSPVYISVFMKIRSQITQLVSSQATLERTHQALEEEKRRTVDLLYSIFPGDVAQKLWQGQPVPARKFDDVTMLFSDIVGFTAVCAQCTPMQVISMLNELYTRFDYQCGILDVYKVSIQI